MELNEQLRADQALIEDALTQYAEQWPSYGVLKDAMSYSLLSGGKRIRPVPCADAGCVSSVRRTVCGCPSLCLRIGDVAHLFFDPR